MEVSGRVQNSLEENGTRAVCTPCEGEGDDVKAHSYCIVCNELLCEQCERAHSRAKMSKRHRFLYGDDMPPRPLDTLEENMCQKHDGNLVEFFCETHDCSCCATCIALEHPGCPTVYVVQLVRGLQENDEFLTTSRHLSTIIDRLEKVSVGEKYQIQGKYEEVVAEIQQFKADIMDTVDRLERVTIAEAQRLRDFHLQIDHLTTSQSKKILSDTRALAKAMEDQKKYQQFKHLAITVRKSAGKISECQDFLERVSTQGNINRYKFEPYHNVFYPREYLQGIAGLGAISVKKDRGQSSPRNLDDVFERQPNLIDRTFRAQNEVNAPKPNDDFFGTNSVLQGKQKADDKPSLSGMKFEVMPKPNGRFSVGSDAIDENPQPIDRNFGTNNAFDGQPKPNGGFHVANIGIMNVPFRQRKKNRTLRPL